jgi:hypothetical protein
VVVFLGISWWNIQKTLADLDEKTTPIRYHHDVN